MQKFLKVSLSIVFLFAGIFAFALRADQASAKNIAATPAAKKLYQANCARCHGADGRGETEAGKLYDVPTLTNQSNRKHIESVIKNGAGSMPAFGRKFSKAQIASLVDYVRAL